MKKAVLLAALAGVQFACAAEEPSDFATQRLAAITERETALYEKMETAPEFYAQADWERRVDDLIADYRSYISDHSEDTSALILYGKLLRRVGEDEQAFKVFLKADELDPQIAVVKQQIGTFLAEDDKPLAALPFYLQAIELAPETAIYHFGLGELLNQFRSTYVEQGVFTHPALDRQMLNAFTKAAALAPGNFDLQMRLGEAYYDLKEPDWKNAILKWNHLESICPSEKTLESIYLHQAMVLAKLGRYKAANTKLTLIQSPALEASKATVRSIIAGSDETP